MLRITTDESQSEPRLLIEGRITRESAGELSKFTEAFLSASVLDLTGVTFVDRQSAQILRGLRDRGATIEGCSAFLTELLVGGGRASDVPSEHDLIAALRAGDDVAFATLVRREGGRMLATARRLLGSDQDAEDAVQDAFLQAHRAIDGFNGDAKISTWLHRIVVNAALMKLRSRRRKPEQPIEELLPKFEETGEWPAAVDGWQRSAEDLIESAECRAIVRRAIDRLPEA